MTNDSPDATDDLASELRRIAATLQVHRDGKRADVESMPNGDSQASPLAQLVAAFGLSAFERDVLLLCAGTELDAQCAALVSELQAGGSANFALALAALPEAHWSATLPDAPLRHWQLIKVGDGPSLVGSPLRIDERVLHHLTGLAPLDATLAGIVAAVAPAGDFAPAHRIIVDRVAAMFGTSDNARGGGTIVQLIGDDSSAVREVAAAAASELSGELFAVAASDLPGDGASIDHLARLWDREARLTPRFLLVSANGVDVEERVRRFADRVEAPLLLVGTRQTIDTLRPVLRVEVPRLSPSEQLALWRAVLGGGEVSEDEFRALSVQFNPTLSTIRGARLAAPSSSGDSMPFAQQVWSYCRDRARGSVGEAAERISSSATWGDLVLPAQQMTMLRTIAQQMRDRAIVYSEWGMPDPGTPSGGIRSLFAGPSGTGKSLAAEVIANDLSIDLYRVSLSTVVSKYIGETEKNLRHMFDNAEAGSAVLLLEESDALFGKRSEVMDSHDRYANIELDYLLQRIAAYRGLVIMTTNLRDAIEPALRRRLGFLVEFPVPDAAERAAIWQLVFPPEMPVDKLDYALLAQLEVVGGSIRNIALSAAFLAAARNVPLTMADIRAAAVAEYAKVDRTLTEAEIQGWP